jgi:tape measure domain-containing protein
MAAQDAELKLKVSLDLAFFRQQLIGLGQAAAGYKIPVQVQFDRRSVQNELNALGRNISQRTYRLEVATNLAAEIKNAGTLAKALRGLDNAVQKNKGIANRTVTGQAVGTVDASSFSAMLNRATKPALEALYQAMAKAKIPMADVGRGTVNELRTSIISGVPAITRDIAQGLANGLDPKLKENGREGAKSFIDAFKSATGIASPSKIFKQLGEFSADGLEIGFLNGLREFKGKAVAEIKKIVALMKLELASVGDVNLRAGIGGARGNVRGGVQYMGPIGPLPLGSAQPWARGDRGMYGGGGYEPYMATQGFGAGGRGASNARSVFASPSMLGLGQLALPAAGQTSASISQQARIAQAYARSSERGASVFGEDIYRQGLRTAAGQVPMGGGRFLPPGGGGGGGPSGGAGGFGMGDFGRAMGGINLPGAGTIRELGSEFGFATKQVLLFGQAYKLLGFAQDLPSQVGNAVSKLQSFRNTLSSITGSAKEAGQANQFILETVDKYNIPLQSARDGFTKLFASMAPAGFSAGEIQDLFLSISKAAATFGMSADKVDRVNYAFAQMASKGQVMSEELKGQLGDVLPGAMGIFAEAAGFKGPDAIQKFGKALEDGAYKGQAMRDLLKNVTIVMNKEFGPGAEGAARTFQGVINRMQNSTQLFYESFEPVAVGFLNSVVVPITSGIKTITDGFTAFLSGTQAQTAGGSAFAAQLKELKPAFDGIQRNIQSLLPIFSQFGQILLQVSKFLIQIAGNPVVGYLAKLYLVALPINLVFGRIATTIGSVYASMTTLNVGLLAGAQRFKTVDMVMKGFNLTAGQATGVLRGIAPALNAVTLGLRAFGATAILAGISLVIERIMSLKGAVDSVRQSTQMMLASISSMANSGAVRELKNLGKDIGKQVSTFEGLRPFVSGQGGRGLPAKRLTPQAAATMEEIGLGGFVGKDVFDKPYVKDFVNASRIIEERLISLRKSAASVKEKLPLAEQAAADLAKQTKAPEITPITSDSGDGKGKTKRIPFEQIADYESQRQAKMAASDKERRLSELIRDARLQGNEAEAESLEALRPALEIRGKIASLEEFRNMLINKENQIVGKSLTQQQFNNKLQNANVELYVLRNELQETFDKLKVDEAKRAKDELKDLDDKIKKQQEFQKLLNATQMAAGTMSPIEMARAQQQQQFADDMARAKELGASQVELADLAKAQAAIPAVGSLEEAMNKLKGELKDLTSLNEVVKNSAKGIGEAFGNSFKEIVNGSMTAQEALASFFQNIGDYFLDMAARMIAKWMEMQVIGLAQNLLSAFSGVGGGGSNVFGGGARGLSTTVGFGTGISGFANGGIAGGGIIPLKAFADGGTVQGPTLGLVGEGRYNEAIVPLPDGRSIPVELQGSNSGDINVIVNVDAKNTQVSGDEGQARALASVVSSAVQAELIKQKRPGGLLRQ